MSDSSKSVPIIILLVSVLVSFGGTLAVHIFSLDFVWNQEPIHSTVEAVGALCAITMAMLLMSLRRDSESQHYIWISSALIAMGILDVLHAGASPGNLFVWLHSIATLAGGLVFAMVLLPDNTSSESISRALPIVTLIIVLIIGIFSIAMSDAVPLMISNGEFTTSAVTINFIGGILFVVAALRFIVLYLKSGSRDDALFATLCTLFGIAGLLFRFSLAWKFDWWFWHLLRLIAYLIALGYVFTVFRKMNIALTALFHEVRNTLLTSTNELLAAITQMAAGTTETATAVSQTTTTIEEVRQTAQLSSQKASHIQENARKTVQGVQNGKRSVNETVEGMACIRRQMASIANSVVKLSEQTRAIGEITASVNDLADQSNLLAVNAAIEAAKAGEEGRGFTVVAQEIRSLAQQSKQATAQVRSILNDVQKAVSQAVMDTEQGSKVVEAGSKLAEQSGEAIQLLSDSVNESAQVAIQIAASSQQQMAGMDQIVPAMENIKQATTQNALSTHQSQNAAQNLYEVGQKLNKLLEQYKI